MTRPSQRSRSFIKKRINTPGGRAVLHFVKKKPSHARCGRCMKPLHGVPRGPALEIAKLPKTKKRPDRPYGGYLCSSCTRKSIKEKNLDRWQNV